MNVWQLILQLDPIFAPLSISEHCQILVLLCFFKFEHLSIHE